MPNTKSTQLTEPLKNDSLIKLDKNDGFGSIKQYKEDTSSSLKVNEDKLPNSADILKQHKKCKMLFKI